MHEMRVLPCPLEVPPTRARRLGGAEEKNAGGGAHFWGLDTLFRGAGAHPCTPVSAGGVENLLG